MMKIILAILVIVGGLMGYAAILPAEYSISRQITINAPAEKVFPFLNNSKIADTWGPWKEADPVAKYTYSGPEAGVGSRVDWADGKELGTGSATIVESIPNQQVKVKLEYTKPMSMTQDAYYILKEANGQSTVTWKVEGKNTFFGRLMCIFINMDKKCGEFFEKGLANLKTMVEKA